MSTAWDLVCITHDVSTELYETGTGARDWLAQVLAARTAIAAVPEHPWRCDLPSEFAFVREHARCWLTIRNEYGDVYGEASPPP